MISRYIQLARASSIGSSAGFRRALGVLRFCARVDSVLETKHVPFCPFH